MLQEYTEEIERLKKDLYAAREKNGIFLSSENFAGMESKIGCQRELIKELEDKIAVNVQEIKKVCKTVQPCIVILCAIEHACIHMWIGKKNSYNESSHNLTS